MVNGVYDNEVNCSGRKSEDEWKEMEDQWSRRELGGVGGDRVE